MAERSKNRTRPSNRGKLLALAVVGICAVLSLVMAYPPQEKINQGLDIQGGLSVVLSAQSTDGEPVTADDMEKSKAIIEDRVNALGANEASVQIQGDNQILVQIPGMSDSQEALATIGKTGLLEFARLDSFTDEEVKNNIDTGNIYDTAEAKTPYVSEGGTTYQLGATDYPHISVESGTYTPLFSGDHITGVTIDRESEGSPYYSVNVDLDGEASAAFAQASRELVTNHGKIVIIIDGTVNSAPAVQSVIDQGRVSITGGYSMKEARSLQTVLDSGSLPVSFNYEQSQTVGPTLGQGELAAGVIAMLLGLLVVMLYLIFFYRGFGTLTAANMVLFALVYLGVLAGLSALGVFSLSLAGIAGIILSIGMAADSSILVIERFKEELKEGRSLKAASQSGVRHAIITSIDADVVSLISALALFFLATSTVKGFGLTLALGIVCDIFVMLLFKAPLVRMLAPHEMRRHPGFWGVRYALALGDVRTGADHLPAAGQVAQEDAKRKQEAAEKAAKRKEYEKAEKERQKELASARKEKERAKTEAEKQKKKEAKVVEKAENAATDEGAESGSSEKADSGDDAVIAEAKIEEESADEAGEADKAASKPNEDIDFAEDAVASDAGIRTADTPEETEPPAHLRAPAHTSEEIAAMLATVTAVNSVNADAEPDADDGDSADASDAGAVGDGKPEHSDGGEDADMAEPAKDAEE